MCISVRVLHFANVEADGAALGIISLHWVNSRWCHHVQVDVCVCVCVSYTASEESSQGRGSRSCHWLVSLTLMSTLLHMAACICMCVSPEMKKYAVEEVDSGL